MTPPNVATATAALPPDDDAPARRPGGLFRIREEIAPRTYVGFVVLSFILPMIAWCALTYSGKANSLILPTPTSVFDALMAAVRDDTLVPNMKISVFRIGMGFLASAVLAIPVGILMGTFKLFEAAHEPLVGFIRYVPVPALIPLVMVSVGIGEPAKILLIFLGTYFQMVIVVADVTRQVPKDLINAARTLGANRLQCLFSVILPATLPGLLETCRTMIGWAWTYLVIAEVVATDSGLGYSIMKAQRFLRTDEIFVGIVVLGLLGLVTDLLFKYLTPRLLPWADAQKS
ncbi:MAG TPA: ABC transporter permease [Capsulimonadaceae bacterium]|jgi:NitT/TauT family transport system permease protein